MSNLSLLLTVTGRERAERFLRFYQEHQLPMQLITFGHGTAGSTILNYLGLDSSLRAVLIGFITEETWKTVKRGLERDLTIDVPGTGIAFTVPLSSVGGGKQLQFLLQEQHFTREEESSLKDTSYELIIAMTNLGYSELVMEAARAAGAQGGTIIHAKGTGLEQAEKFLGISMAAEKELILIVTHTEKREQIMRTVMQRAGLLSKAKTILFSLPVTDTAGLRLIVDD